MFIKKRLYLLSTLYGETHLILPRPQEVGTIIVSILQMRRLRHRELGTPLLHKSEGKAHGLESLLFSSFHF